MSEVVNNRKRIVETGHDRDKKMGTGIITKPDMMGNGNCNTTGHNRDKTTVINRP